ncbi:Class I heat shock protein [Melia azedarach]|uniref:Class I heat shock protein n=1 Tax=Melia azedarach TaxID=155640 RepID=A0ACC1WPW1_MELAZ|nr:Class I heat shock protein [Melia azedarach]
MTSLGPWFGGGRRGGFDPMWFGTPYSSDMWDPFSSGTIWTADQYRGSGDETAALAHAHVDWQETDTAHIFHADLPGVRKEEVKVQVEDGNVLQISGEKSKEQEDVNDKWHRVERRRGSFVRRFRLPENANLDEIKCAMDHGVLRVTVPKKNVEDTPRNVRYIDVA